MIFHKETKDTGRWNKFSIVEQMANIGSEVERTIKWKNAGDLEASMKAFDRALELISFTFEDPKNRGRLKELGRLREFMINYFYYDNSYNFNDQELKKYFHYFTYVAAIRRGR